MGTDSGLEGEVVLAEEGRRFLLDVPCARRFLSLHTKLSCDGWGTERFWEDLWQGCSTPLGCDLFPRVAGHERGQGRKEAVLLA